MKGKQHGWLVMIHHTCLPVYHHWCWYITLVSQCTITGADTSHLSPSVPSLVLIHHTCLPVYHHWCWYITLVVSQCTITGADAIHHTCLPTCHHCCWHSALHLLSLSVLSLSLIQCLTLVIYQSTVTADDTSHLLYQSARGWRHRWIWAPQHWNFCNHPGQWGFCQVSDIHKHVWGFQQSIVIFQVH